MANYANIGIDPVPFVAGVDLTAAQFKGLRFSGGNVIAQAAAGASGAGFAGVLQNSPSLNEVATVTVLGPTKAVCRATACVLQHARYLACASDGLFEVPTSAGSPVVARYFGPSVTTAGASVVAEIFVLGAAVVAAGAS